ncbi:MAG: hypothetical protein JRJ82_20380 [Deltaproteobacteria bacterium]|nr:hypothetical protein [Deltaproteobacteria bacterium]
MQDGSFQVQDYEINLVPLLFVGPHKDLPFLDLKTPDIRKVAGILNLEPLGYYPPLSSSTGMSHLLLDEFILKVIGYADFFA